MIYRDIPQEQCKSAEEDPITLGETGLRYIYRGNLNETRGFTRYVNICENEGQVLHHVSL